MDNIWQQHRSFILKIMAGLGILLVLWIIGSSVHDLSLSDRVRANKAKRSTLKRKEIPSKSAIADYEEAAEKLETRVRFLATRAGETRKGEELRRGLIGEILRKIELFTPENVDRYVQDARTQPKACVTELAGKASEYLSGKASLVNVVLERELDTVVQDMEDADIDRYLLCLRLIVDVIEIAIDERVFEVKSVSIAPPPGGRFEGEALFVREYPVNIEIRGGADAVLNFVERLNDPDRFVPVTEVRRIGADRSSKDKSLVVADLELAALKIDPGAEHVESAQ